MTPFILLTRPDGKNARLQACLQQKGLEVLDLPALALAADTRSDVPDPAGYDLIVFVSGFAVDCYVRALRHTTQFAWPSGTYAAAVGVASAAALAQSGLVPPQRIVAPEAGSSQDSEALWEELQQRNIQPRRVLIVCGDSGRNWLAERLEQCSASVVRYRAYVREPAHWQAGQLARLAELAGSGRRAIILLTSRQGVDAWLSNLQQAGMEMLVLQADFVVVHERIAEHLMQNIAYLYQDAKPIIIVSKPDDADMFRSIMTLCPGMGD